MGSSEEKPRVSNDAAHDGKGDAANEPSRSKRLRTMRSSEHGVKKRGLFDLMTPDFLLSTGSILEVAGSALIVMGEIGSRRNGQSRNLKELEEAEKRLSEIQEQLRKVRSELERSSD